MANGADPGEIGPWRRLVRHRNRPPPSWHTPASGLSANRCRAIARWRRASRRSSRRRWELRQRREGQVPDAPPTSSKWRNCSGWSWATSPSAIGPEMACMAGAMKLSRSAAAPRMLAGRGAGTPSLTVHANCDQPRKILLACKSIGSTVCDPSAASQSRTSRPERDTAHPPWPTDPTRPRRLGAWWWPADRNAVFWPALRPTADTRSAGSKRRSAAVTITHAGRKPFSRFESVAGQVVD